MRESEIIHNQKQWKGKKEQEGKHIRQLQVVLDVPTKYQGQHVAIYICLIAETGDNKSDWHFEGVSVTVRNAIKIEGIVHKEPEKESLEELDYYDIY